MYLMKGMAVLAMGLVAASCNKLDFSGQPEVSDEEALANAEMALGINIDPSQDWNMTQQATASVDVNMGNGKAYSVAIYSNNPILDGQGVVMAEGNVADGGHFSTNFTCPKGSTEFYIGLTDAKNYTIYKPAKLEDGVLKVAFGSTANNASRRSVTIGNDVYDEFTFPTAEELEAAFPTSIPTGAEEVADLTTTGKYNNEDYNYNDLWWIYSRNGEGYNYKVTKNDEVTIGGGWNNADENGYHYFNVYVNVTGNVTLKRQGSPHFNLYILKGNVTIDSK